jgi:hypothetical protein
MDHTNYWKRIKINIEKLYINDLIKENYSYESFCDEFVPCEYPIEKPYKRECLCDHPIKHNYTYTHQTNKDEMILGSCCIKKFSTMYKNRRTCKDCNIHIYKNKDNICTECRSYRKKEIKRMEEIKKLEERQKIEEEKKEERLKIEQEKKEERQRFEETMNRIEKRQREIKAQRYIDSCRCKECNYIKKDNKYKYCYNCYKKKYN